MTTIQALPYYILHRIMWYLPLRPTMRECVSVNRIFSQIALSFIYEKCTLSENDLYIKPSELCFMKKKTFERIKMFGKYIRILQIVTAAVTPNELLPCQSFKLLLPYLPNVIAIDLSRTKFQKFYLNVLQLSKTSLLIHVQEINLFKIGSTIEEGTNMIDLMKVYFPTCWRFRHSLTHLDLFDTSKVFMLDGNIGKSVELVPFFEKLKTVCTYETKNGVSCDRTKLHHTVYNLSKATVGYNSVKDTIIS